LFITPPPQTKVLHGCLLVSLLKQIAYAKKMVLKDNKIHHEKVSVTLSLFTKSNDNQKDGTSVLAGTHPISLLNARFKKTGFIATKTNDGSQNALDLNNLGYMLLHWGSG